MRPLTPVYTRRARTKRTRRQSFSVQLGWNFGSIFWTTGGRTGTSMSPEQTVCFSSFRLDLPNQRLCGREDPIPLRPKTFGVLRYLVEHAGRLVTREELVKAVWPDTHGAGKGPKRCIFELRAALSDRVD